MEMQTSTTILENSLIVSYKKHLDYDFVILFLGINPRKLKIYVT